MRGSRVRLEEEAAREADEMVVARPREPPIGPHAEDRASDPQEALAATMVELHDYIRLRAAVEFTRGSVGEIPKDQIPALLAAEKGPSVYCPGRRKMSSTKSPS